MQMGLGAVEPSLERSWGPTRQAQKLALPSKLQASAMVQHQALQASTTPGIELANMQTISGGEGEGIRSLARLQLGRCVFTHPFKCVIVHTEVIRLQNWLAAACAGSKSTSTDVPLGLRVLLLLCSFVVLVAFATAPRKDSPSKSARLPAPSRSIFPKRTLSAMERPPKSLLATKRFDSATRAS